MVSLIHFHSRNVYFYIHYSNSLKVTALDMFLKQMGSHPLNLKTIIFQCSKNYDSPTRVTRLKVAPNMVDPISLTENIS